MTGWRQKLRDAILAGLLVLLLGAPLLLWRGNPARDTNPPDAPSIPRQRETPSGTPWFEDVSDQVGIDFVHDPGPLDQRYFMPQIVGSGAALLDIDGDGRLDIYLLNNGGPRGRPNVLYRQLPGFTFRDVSEGSGLDVSAFCMGAACGDVNNDGRPDVLITEFGGLRLFVNEGEGRFAECRDAGVESTLWGTSACFLDYDRDGWLDIATANYVDYDPAWPCENARSQRDYCHPNVFPGTAAKLFHNISSQKSTAAAQPVNTPRFEDVTVSSQLARFPSAGLGVASADFDGDGWPDLFVANDAQPNHLWMNQRDGTFAEDAVTRGLAYDAVGRSLANMGVALGDTCGEGRFDVFVTHLREETNTLWRQEMRGIFADRTASSGLLQTRGRGTGFGAVLGDFDQDGWLDLAIANGRVVRAHDTPNGDHWSHYAERNHLFAGTAPGTFRDISTSNPAFCKQPDVGRALAVGDVDGDGALDLLLTCAGGRARLFRNVAKPRGHWLRIKAWDPRLKREAFGAELTVVAAGQRHVAWVNPGQSFLASNDSRVHFGLGAAASIDAIEVLWPDGLREHFAGASVDTSIVLTRGEGTPTPQPPSTGIDLP